MKIIGIDRLGQENYNPIFINALRQFWKNTNSFQCIGSPKKQNLLLYLDGCRITYTDKNGDTYSAESGDVVYTPLGGEYRATLFDFLSPSSHTVGINFLLLDEVGEGILLSDRIVVFRGHDQSEIATLFDKAAVTDGGLSSVSNRILLMEILSRFSQVSPTANDRVVALCIEHLSREVEKNPSISELARKCNVSEVYLRRRFKEVMGVSPAKYRNGIRLDKAVSYLTFGDISVQEISDALGYATVSHFIKEFKKRFGVSPLQYKKLKK